jgi:hypothetical protein
MVTPTDLSIWLHEQAWPLVIIAFIVIFTYVALRVSAHRRQQTLAQERAGVSDQTFADYLEQFGFDPAITSSTYRYLQEVQGINFPILPSDDLDEDLGLGTEEIEQTLRELTGALKREFNKGMVHAPLVTVEDLVRFIQASPRVVQANVA